MDAEHGVILDGAATGACHSNGVSNAAQDKRPALVTRRKRDPMISGMLSWRPGPAPSWNRRSTQLDRGCRQPHTAFQQAIAELKLLSNQVPASLHIRPSLNQWFAANASFTIPAYFMLDAGSPYAISFFSILDFKDIYHAVLGMLLSWLHGEFPKQYPLSAARFHQTKAIPILRQRLVQGMHNDETYVIMLCAMQTDALLGDRTALAMHRRGLEALSQMMTGRLDEYCTSIKPKVDFFVTEATKSPPPSPGSEDPSHLLERLYYPTAPYPDQVMQTICSLPAGLRDLALQPNGMSLEMINWWAALLQWLAQVNSGSPFDSDFFDMHSSYTQLWHILERLDPHSASLERCSCIGIYLHMASLYYRHLVYTSAVFITLRAEATDTVRRYHPRNPAERDFLIFHGVKIFKHWRTTGPEVPPEGVALLTNLKRRFPEVRQWDALLVVLNKFPFFGPDIHEWKDVWMQASM